MSIDVHHAPANKLIFSCVYEVLPKKNTYKQLVTTNTQGSLLISQKQNPRRKNGYERKQETLK